MANPNAEVDLLGAAIEVLHAVATQLLYVRLDLENSVSDHVEEIGRDRRLLLRHTTHWLEGPYQSLSSQAQHDPEAKIIRIVHQPRRSLPTLTPQASVNG